MASLRRRQKKKSKKKRMRSTQKKSQHQRPSFLERYQKCGRAFDAFCLNRQISACFAAASRRVAASTLEFQNNSFVTSIGNNVRFNHTLNIFQFDTQILAICLIIQFDLMMKYILLKEVKQCQSLQRHVIRPLVYVIGGMTLGVRVCIWTLHTANGNDIDISL